MFLTQELQKVAFKPGRRLALNILNARSPRELHHQLGLLGRLTGEGADATSKALGAQVLRTVRGGRPAHAGVARGAEAIASKNFQGLVKKYEQSRVWSPGARTEPHPLKSALGGRWRMDMGLHR